jgi:hypothetical protein
MKERGPDLAMVVIGLVLAALLRASTFAGLLGALAIAFVVVDVARLVGWPRAPIAMSRSALAVGLALVLAVPLYDLAVRTRTIAEAEGISGLVEHVGDRARLEALPSIAPPLVPGDRPLTYFVHATGERVRVRLGPSTEWIDAEPLGHDVFRVEHDPRVSGAPAPDAHETLASIEVDGSVTERTLVAVTPAPHPRWLRLSPNRTRACVTSEESDEVVRFAVDEEPTRTPTLDGPTDCAITDEGRVIVAHRYADALLVLDATSRRVVGLGARGAVSVSLVGERILVALDGASAQILRLSLASPTAIERAPLEGHPTFLVAAEATALVTTTAPATIARLATEGELRVSATRALVAPAVHVALAPDASSVVLAVTDFVEDGAPHLGNHYVEDRLVTLDATTLLVMADRATARRTPRQDHAGDVDRGASPMGLSFTARGTLLVAFAGTDEVWELDGLARPDVVDTAQHGLSAPFSAVELANGVRLVTSPSSGRIGTFSQGFVLSSARVMAETDRELLRADPDALQLRFGERAFYEATRAGVSCQSCHLHGGSDGAFHNIGGRLSAPTLDVRGVLGTSPYLRDGSYPMLRDLHEVAVTEYRGYREPGGDRARTLEAWMRTLPPPATFVARDPAQERAGLDVFVRAGCADCHAPPAFTSLALHPIRAVFPDAPTRAEGRVLDTPSLRSLASSAPYLYDGRAASIESVIRDHNTSDRHGHTRDLSEDELAALFTFLRSL